MIEIYNFLWASCVTTFVMLTIISVFMLVITDIKSYRNYIVYALLFIIVLFSFYSEIKVFFVENTFLNKENYVYFISFIQNVSFSFYALFTIDFLRFPQSNYKKQARWAVQFYKSFIIVNIILFIGVLLFNSVELFRIINYFTFPPIFIIASIYFIYFLLKEMNVIKGFYMFGLLSLLLCFIVAYIIIYFLEINYVNNSLLGQSIFFAGLIIENISLAICGILLYIKQVKDLEEEKKLLNEISNKETISHLESLTRTIDREQDVFNKKIQSKIERDIEYASFQLSAIEEDKPEFLKAKKVLNESLEIIQNQTNNFYPDLLNKMGLTQAIEYYARLHSTTKILVIDNTTNVEIRSEVRSVLFAVLCELVDNIHYHSKATKGLIIIDEDEHTLYFEVKDNGVGFIMNRDEHVGIKTVEHKIKLLKGKFFIDAEVDKGTTFKIELLKQEL